MRFKKIAGKKTLARIILPAILFFVLASTIFAASVDIAPFNKGDTASPVTSAPQIFGIVRNIVIWIYRAFFVVAVIFLLIAAYNFIQGGTNPEKIKVAKGQIKYAVISIVVALVASGLSWIIAQFLVSGGAF